MFKKSLLAVWHGWAASFFAVESCSWGERTGIELVRWRESRPPPVMVKEQPTRAILVKDSRPWVIMPPLSVAVTASSVSPSSCVSKRVVCDILNCILFVFSFRLPLSKFKDGTKLPFLLIDGYYLGDCSVSEIELLTMPLSGLKHSCC